MALDAKQLLQMSQQQLDELFSAHDSGPIPMVKPRARPSLCRTPMSESIAAFINIFAWQRVSTPSNQRAFAFTYRPGADSPGG
jgi:hypothetical protein